MTVDDYLAWADSQSEKVRAELINGQIVPMAPERVAHNRTKFSVAVALRQAIKSAGVPCEAFTDGLTVPIDPHTAYEPDVLVHCGDRLSDAQMTAPAPIIVVEVISPTSADTSAKLIGYFKLPSVRHYLVIDPEPRTVTHHRRGDDGAMSLQILASGTLQLDPSGLTVEVADFFA